MHVRDDDDVAQMFGTAYMVLTGHAPDAPTFDEITMMTRDVDGIGPADWIDRSEVVLDHLAPDGVDPDDVVAPDVWRRVETTTPARPRRWVRAATFAAALLVVVGGLVVASRDRESVPAPAVTEPVPSPTVTVPNSVPSPTVVDALGYRWSRIAPDDAVLGGAGNDPRMSSVTAGGPGLVAVGSNGWDGLDDQGDAAVWTSVDGISWLPVPHDEDVFGGEDNQGMSSVTVGGPGLVAVGSDASTAPEYGGTKYFSGVAAVWTSVDGLTWTRVPHDEAVFGGEGVQWMNSVTVGGPGLVAVGSVGSVDPDGVIIDEDAAVWTSVDGLTWSRVPHDEALFGGASIQRMNSVTAGGPGLVAVGQASRRCLADCEDDEDGFDGDAAVWTSVDGLIWSRVTGDASMFGEPGLQRMNSVTVGGPGLVAVGFGPVTETCRFSTAAAVWTSVDGITWSRVPHDETVFGGCGDQEMFAVTSVVSSLVGVGWAGRAGTQGAAVWTSVDGIIWSRVPHDRAVFGGTVHQGMFSVTAGGPGLVAVGLGSLDGDSDSAVMSEQLPEGPSRPGILIATLEN